ncbi:hypothetical protein BGX26_004308 [Mortierella sp. AD094]|nr:hypothetical protein BGX26_004308 [Mortierella sp. AD094]
MDQYFNHIKATRHRSEVEQGAKLGVGSGDTAIFQEPRQQHQQPQYYQIDPPENTQPRPSSIQQEPKDVATTAHRVNIDASFVLYPTRSSSTTTKARSAVNSATISSNILADRSVGSGSDKATQYPLKSGTASSKRFNQDRIRPRISTDCSADHVDDIGADWSIRSHAHSQQPHAHSPLVDQHSQTTSLPRYRHRHELYSQDGYQPSHSLHFEQHDHDYHGTQPPGAASIPSSQTTKTEEDIRTGHEEAIEELRSSMAYRDSTRQHAEDPDKNQSQRPFRSNSTAYRENPVRRTKSSQNDDIDWDQAPKRHSSQSSRQFQPKYHSLHIHEYSSMETPEGYQNAFKRHLHQTHGTHLYQSYEYVPNRELSPESPTENENTEAYPRRRDQRHTSFGQDSEPEQSRVRKLRRFHPHNQWVSPPRDTRPLNHPVILSDDQEYYSDRHEQEQQGQQYHSDSTQYSTGTGSRTPLVSKPDRSHQGIRFLSMVHNSIGNQESMKDFNVDTNMIYGSFMNMANSRCHQTSWMTNNAGDCRDIENKNEQQHQNAQDSSTQREEKSRDGIPVGKSYEINVEYDKQGDSAAEEEKREDREERVEGKERVSHSDDLYEATAESGHDLYSAPTTRSGTRRLSSREDISLSWPYKNMRQRKTSGQSLAILPEEIPSKGSSKDSAIFPSDRKPKVSLDLFRRRSAHGGTVPVISQTTESQDRSQSMEIEQSQDEVPYANQDSLDEHSEPLLSLQGFHATTHPESRDTQQPTPFQDQDSSLSSSANINSSTNATRPGLIASTEPNSGSGFLHATSHSEVVQDLPSRLPSRYWAHGPQPLEASSAGPYSDSQFTHSSETRVATESTGGLQRGLIGRGRSSEVPTSGVNTASGSADGSYIADLQSPDGHILSNPNSAYGQLDGMRTALRLGKEGYYTTKDLKALFEVWRAEYEAAKSLIRIDGMERGADGTSQSRMRGSHHQDNQKGRQRKRYSHSSSEDSQGDNESKDDEDNGEESSDEDSDNEDSNNKRARSSKQKWPSKRTKSKRRKGKKVVPESKRHECPICQKSFSRPSQLDTHRLTHTGEKPHVCSMCHKHFNVASNLKRHIRTHGTGKRGSLTGDPTMKFPLTNMIGINPELNDISNTLVQTLHNRSAADQMQVQLPQQQQQQQQQQPQQHQPDQQEGQQQRKRLVPWEELESLSAIYSTPGTIAAPSLTTSTPLAATSIAISSELHQSPYLN